MAQLFRGARDVLMQPGTGRRIATLFPALVLVNPGVGEVAGAAASRNGLRAFRTGQKKTLKTRRDRDQK